MWCLTVKIADKNNNTAHIYSGMAILKSKILNNKFKNFKNFEVELYPKVIKKHKCKFIKFSGFWHSIDNIKDIKMLKSDTNKKNAVKKLLKKLR